MGDWGAREKGEHPCGGRLVACDEAFGAKLVDVSFSFLISCFHVGSGRWRRTIPVEGSTDRDSVSTAITWVDLSFHGQYLRQFAVETSSHE